MISKKTNLTILTSISGSHLLNDMMQSILVAIYPILQSDFSLTFSQIGLITFTYQCTASFLQPLIGIYTDKNPKPFSLPIGMLITMVGFIVLAFATNFHIILLAASMIGIGSAIFHPESSRVARLASGGRYGFAQSFFQVGGNLGTSLGPLLAALIITPYGKQNMGYFSLCALLGAIILFRVSKWYTAQNKNKKSNNDQVSETKKLSRKVVVISLVILLALVFSKAFYLSSITSYYTFYLMHKFSVTEQDSQIYLFIFLFSVAAGTFMGGPIGDRIGRKYVIWISILGVAPFTLLLPYANLSWTIALSILIGLILSSAFSAILVFAQELVPGKVGTVSGLFFGFSFGMGGLGAAILGKVADKTSIEYVYTLCSYLPLIGLLTVFLPGKKALKG
ncbi:MFS transporter [Apibacter muscae]|uniref:MFS transporter n=1 Tax=Apibacter muscae TaxID=2509004 RepID=UPI0011AD0E31|nr:MFS transporter [Apibacter muscae]TWP28509.1 MFS transporter [Apibacter muscae]